MKLSRLSIPYRAVKTAGSILAIGIFTSIESLKLAPGYALTMLGIFGFGAFLMAGWYYLVWKNYSFEITSDTFDIRSGVIRKKRREIPLHRIQNVDVSRNIFQRILRIAKVNLETAGGKTSEASLKYVDRQNSKQIQKKVRELKEDAETVREDKSDHPLFSLTEKELGILSATSLNLKALSTIFIGFSVLGAFGPAIEDSINLAVLTLVGLTTVTIVLGSLLISAAANINKFYGFKLYRRGDSLEYERGLLNRSEGSIPFEKIQNLRIEENPLKRLFGYATLKVETAGFSGQNQQQQGPEVAVPLAERDRIDELSNEIFEHGSYDIQGVSDRALRRYFGRYTLASVIPVTAVLGASRVFELGINPLFVLGIIPFLGAAAYLKYMNKGFYEGKEFFYTQNGFWNRKTTITPYYRIQNLTQSQTVFQERLGLSSLILDTAGIYALASNPKACDLDEEVAENLFNRVFESFKSSTKN